MLYCDIMAVHVLSDQKDQVVLKVPPGTQNQLVLLVLQKKSNYQKTTKCRKIRVSTAKTEKLARVLLVNFKG